jgi:hypothetical protein
MATKKVVKHQTRKHSLFSASSSERWLNCHGSVELSKTAPPQKESAYAREGTQAHECLEFLVRRWVNRHAIRKHLEKKYNEEMVEHAFTAGEIIFSLKPSTSAKLLIETKVELKQIGPGLFGTLDYAWVTREELVVIDYKYGQGVAVFPFDEETNEENSQLMYYAAGIANKVGYNFKSLDLVVIQPRIWSDEGDVHFKHRTTIDRLRAFEKKIAQAVTKAKKPKAELKAGSWCKWCPAGPECPEISENQMRKADIFFNDESKTIQAVREHAFIVAQRGEKIQGRKLVQKRSTRVWLPDAEKALLKTFENPFEPAKLMSPAQLEKAYGKAAKSFTEEFTTNLSSGVTLVKESDKRSEIKDVSIFEDL